MLTSSKDTLIKAQTDESNVASREKQTRRPPGCVYVSVSAGIYWNNQTKTLPQSNHQNLSRLRRGPITHWVTGF